MSTSGDLTVTHHKTLLSTSNPFEQKFGYHRAVRRGPLIAVSGTTALKLLSQSPSLASISEAPSSEGSESRCHFPGNAYSQSIHVLETCLAAIVRLGGKKEDVVRVRMLVADSKDCGVVGDAFREVFGTNDKESVSDGKEDLVGTTATMIVVPGGFVDGDILVEIEVDAFVL